MPARLALGLADARQHARRKDEIIDVLYTRGMRTLRAPSMRLGVLVGIVLSTMSCGGSPRTAPQAKTSRPPPDPATYSEFVCDPPSASTASPLSSLPIEQGGYRLAQDDTAIQTLRDAVAGSKTASDADDEHAEARRWTEALGAAIRDLKPRMKKCIEAADQVVPDLQYTLRVHVVGAPGVGSYVDYVTFLRIDGVKGNEPIEVKTSAAKCVADLLGRLELPPSRGMWGMSEMATTLRYDDCTPKIFIAKAYVQRYASTAYASWSAAHPGKQCPDRIDELVRAAGPKASADDPWGRPYQLVCGSALPSTVSGVGVFSFGSDGKSGTYDDVESWNDQGVTRGWR